MVRTREAGETRGLVRLGAFELQRDPLSLMRDGSEIPTSDIILRLLGVLAERPGAFVPKDVLLDRVWPDVAVTEASLYAALRDARRALGDDGRRQERIETRKGRGYRLVPSGPKASVVQEEDVVTRLVVDRLGSSDPALVRRLRERTGGDEALAETLVEQLAAEGQQGPVVALLAESLTLRRGAVEARAASWAPLPDAVVEALRPVALLSGSFARTTPGVDVPADVLGQALEAGWLETVPERPHHYRFRDAAAREWLQQGIPAQEREALHARFGFAWQQTIGLEDLALRSAEVARHFRMAGGAVPVADAVAASRAAASAADDLHERRLHLAAAVLRADHEPYSVRYALASDLGKASFRVGDHEAGRAAYRDAARMARTQGAAEGFAEAALGHAGLSANTETAAPSPERIELLEEALASAATLAPALVARLEARLALELRWTARAAETEPRIARALECVRKPHIGQAARAAVLHDAYWATWSPDDLARRDALARELVAAAGDSEDPVDRLLAHSLLAATRLEAGDRSGSEAAQREGRDMTPAGAHAGIPLWEASARACDCALDARFDEAERWMHRARELSRAFGSRNGDLVFAAQLAWLRYDQERYDELAGIATAATKSSLPVTRAGAALILACSGRETEARAQLEVLMEGVTALPRDAFWLATLSTLAELAARVGDGSAARALAAQLAPYADRCVLIGMRTVCRGSAAHALGVAHASAGERAEAVAALETAVRVNARIAAPALLARSQRALADALDRPGSDPRRARMLRLEAARTRDQIGLDV